MPNYKCLKRTAVPTRRHRRRSLQRPAEINGDKAAGARCYRAIDRELYDIVEDAIDCEHAPLLVPSSDRKKLTPDFDATWWCFLWTSVIIETWIADSERRLDSASSGGDNLQSISVLLKKQLIFTQRLNTYETKDVARLFHLKCHLTSLCEVQEDLMGYNRDAIIGKYDQIMSRWYDLCRKSDKRKVQLTTMLQRCKTRQLQEKFATRAETIQSWFASVTVDLTRPVSYGSTKELTDLRKSLAKLERSMKGMRQAIRALANFNEAVRRYSAVSSNPYTDVTIGSLDSVWENVSRLISERKRVLVKYSNTRTETSGCWLYRLWRFIRNRA